MRAMRLQVHEEMEARTRLEARVTLARQWHRSVVAAACRHNAAVAAQCNEPELANCWRTLQALSNDPSPTSRLLHHGGGGSQPSSGHPTPTSSLPQPQFQQLRPAAPEFLSSASTAER
eukprot:COSAG05_NODE_2_length_63105_cov_159.292956_1_plen_117_part_10